MDVRRVKTCLIADIDDVNQFADNITQTTNYQHLRFFYRPFSGHHHLKQADFDRLVSGLKSQRQLTSLELNLTSNQINKNKIRSLVQLFSAESKLQQLVLFLTHTGIKDESVKLLVESLRMAACPRALLLDLGTNTVHDDGAILLSQILRSRYSPAEMILRLDGNFITDKGGVALAKGLRKRHTPTSLTLNLAANAISDKTLSEFGVSLQNKYCPRNLSLNFYGMNPFSIDGFKNLTQGLNNPHCPVQLALAFSWVHQGDAALKTMASNLLHQYCPRDVSLRMTWSAITDEGIRSLVPLISHEHAPVNLALNLNHNLITTKGIEYIVNALQQQKTIEYFTLKLQGNNDIDQNGYKMLAEMLVHPNCPQNISLKIEISSDDKDAILYYINVLNHPDCPRNIKLNLRHSYWGPDIEKLFVDALMSNTCLTSLRMIAVSRDNLKKIEYYCLRNSLIQQYPQYASIIKRMSYEHGLYQPGFELQQKEQFAPVSSLRVNLIHYFYQNQINLQNDIIKLPVELQQSINELNAIYAKLSTSLTAVNHSRDQLWVIDAT